MKDKIGRVGKKNIEVLRRRQEYLEQRIAENPDKELSYDRAEASALKWAIEKITSNK